MPNSLEIGNAALYPRKVGDHQCSQEKPFPRNPLTQKSKKLHLGNGYFESGIKQDKTGPTFIHLVESQYRYNIEITGITTGSTPNILHRA